MNTDRIKELQAETAYPDSISVQQALLKVWNETVRDNKVIEPQALAVLFHETYERLAPEYGYETRPDTKKFDPETDNGRLMIAVCEEIIHNLPTSDVLNKS